MDSADRILLGAIVRPAEPSGAPAADLLDAIERHRAAPLAWDTLVTTGHAEAWPEELRARLRRASARQALASDLLDTELRRLVDSTGAAGIPTVLIKGAALAYTHYRRPHLRPRNDSDVVVREEDRDGAFRVLATLGYVPTEAVTGALITQQAQWTRSLAGHVLHAVDLHWRLFNPHLFGAVLPTSVLFERAMPVPALGPHARAPYPGDALLLACVHRAAHHAGEEDLLWDFDVHLIVSALNDDQAAEVAGLAETAGVRAVMAAALAGARARFGTRVPAPLGEVLDRASAHREPTAAFLAPGRRQVDVLTSDLAAVSGWRARARLLREHLFPSPAYMRAKYKLRSGALLPFAYAHRIVAGVPRWLRSQRP